MGDIDTDGLVQKLMAGIKKAGRSNGGGDDLDLEVAGGGRAGQMVPLERLRREIEKRQGLEAALGELGGQVEQLQKGFDTRVAALQEQAGKDATALQLRHQEDLALVDLGLTDPLGRKTVRAAFDDLPKKDRPDSVTGWWKGTVEAHKAHLADPKKAEAPTVPRALTPYLPEAPKGGGQQRQTLQQVPGPGESRADGLPQADSLDGWFAGLAAQERSAG